MGQFPRMLAIDPGTNCGYAYIDVPQPAPKTLKAQIETAGLWDLSNARFEDDGMRYLRLEKHLFDVNPDMVLYEQVKFQHKSRQAASVYHSMVNTIRMFCKKNNVACTGIDTNALKSRAVGKGGGKGTKKPDITAAANEFFGTDFSLVDKPGNKDHNISDAMWILQCGIETWADVLRPKSGWPETAASDYFPKKVALKREGSIIRLIDVDLESAEDGELCRFTGTDGDLPLNMRLAFAESLVKLINKKGK